MNSYEAKQEARKERYQSKAVKAEQESNDRFSASRKITEMIPMGQPILVGHHSESGHRAALKRSAQNMDKSVEANKKAEYYEQKAASVGTGGISSDDPEAITKLQAKLAGLKQGQEYMKEINAKYRKAKGDPDKMDVPEITKQMIRKTKKDYYLGPGRFKPFEGFSLSNNNANIKSVEKRIAALKSTAVKPPETVICEGFKVKECPDDNRIRIFFDEKPGPEIRQFLKSHGWRWSPSNNAWQRQRTNNGRYSARVVIAHLKSSQPWKESK